MKILFLDFDGVLHPFNVRFNEDLELTLECDDKSLHLFCWVPILESILNEVDPECHIKIVLSTSWAHRYGWEDAAKLLTPVLDSRVVGRTNGYNRARGLQILKCVEDMNIAYNNWLALDDDDYLWPTHFLNQLIKTDENLGLSEISTQQILRLKLKELLLR